MEADKSGADMYGFMVDVLVWSIYSVNTNVLTQKDLEKVVAEMKLKEHFSVKIFDFLREGSERVILKLTLERLKQLSKKGRKKGRK
jgi:ATP sulfurylase